jgi:hypothetical protein
MAKKISTIKDRAKSSGLPFDLDILYLKELLRRQQNKCFYSDEEIKFYGYGMTPNRMVAPSIDRVIPELGYVKGNVVWCIYRVNVIKNNMTLNEMMDWSPNWYDRIINESYVYKF